MVTQQKTDQHFDFDARTTCSQCHEKGVACVVFHFGDDGEATHVCFVCLYQAHAQMRRYLDEGAKYPTDRALLQVAEAAIGSRERGLGSEALESEFFQEVKLEIGRRVWLRVLREMGSPA